MKRPLGFALGLLLVGVAACTQSGGPLKVDSVEPPQGTTAGGEEITIVGGGFQPGKTQAQVKFGRKIAETVTIASPSKIRVVTPVEREGAGRRARVVRRRRRVQDSERLPLPGAHAGRQRPPRVLLGQQAGLEPHRQDRSREGGAVVGRGCGPSNAEVCVSNAARRFGTLRGFRARRRSSWISSARGGRAAGPSARTSRSAPARSERIRRNVPFDEPRSERKTWLSLIAMRACDPET